MSDNFYRAFEEKYRGSRELIKSRLEGYRPFLDPLFQLDPAPKAIDLGCGRGEWLEYISSLGFIAKGIDLDERMLSACEELSLSTEKGDLLRYIRSLDPESVFLVTAFHVVEHMAFDDVRSLVNESLRVLKPGGLLIMETPNPDNIVVGTRTFYMDPTHNKPIPAELLSFIAEYSGFDRIKAAGLQEPKNISSKVDVGLWDIVFGVSPDYAVVAQKKGEAEVMAAFDSVFESHFGVGLDLLAGRFDDELIDLKNQVEKAVSQTRAAQDEARKAHDEASKAQAFAIEAETRFAAIVEAMTCSTSWKITAPLRLAGRMLNSVRTASVRRKTKLLLQHSALYIARRPRLKRFVLAVLKQFPSLKLRLVRLRAHQTTAPLHTDHLVPSELADLSPHARRIYLELKGVINKFSKEGH